MAMRLLICSNVPAGFHVIKLIKNLCDLYQGGHSFYEKLKSELEKQGDVKSAADPCTYYKKGIIVL